MIPRTNEFQNSIDDPWRQKFHLSPPVGLLNDPNGLIYWKGEYHVFFQWNPYDCKHGRKAWAHVRSADLINWEWLPSALAPEEWYETHGCYSGSAVCCDDKLFLLYTGNVRTQSGGRESYQCLAQSTDGIAFEKLGPVIGTPKERYTAHFRDPKVWREGAEWLMVLGAQTADGDGTVLLYRSQDLKCWGDRQQLVKPGAHGYMCECPDFFTVDGKDILLLSEQHIVGTGDEAIQRNVSGYVSGVLSRVSWNFSYEPFQPLDHGSDFYAPQTFEGQNGRRLMYAWMGNPEAPKSPSAAYGWMHCLTLPRQLRWDGKRLRQLPAEELKALRKDVKSFDNLVVAEELELPGVRGRSYEMEVDFDTACEGSWYFDLCCGAGEMTRLSYSSKEGRLVLDKQLSGNGVSGASTLPLTSGRVHQLQIFVDSSSIEVFVNHGEGCISERIFPSAGSEVIRFGVSKGSVKIEKLNFWSL